MSSRNSVRRGIATFGVLLLACAVYADDAAYRQGVEKWRNDYEAELKSESGWLSVAGLFWLHEGENHFGSDPLNDIVLPAAAVPALTGYFDFHGGKTTVHLNPGVSATIGGKPIHDAELKPDVKEDWLVIGDLSLYVHASGDRFAIRLRDKNSKLRREFTGAKWFPIDESYAVTAKFVPYDPPKKLDTQNVLGDPIKLGIVGYATFALKGQEYRLEVGVHDTGKPGLFIVFRDLTSGKETYPASRFLDADDPKDGPGGKTVWLDFNKAYNPPCAYNPYTTCPLPLPENRLRVEIPAGEKIYKRHE
jgi:uncharacterized protein